MLKHSLQGILFEQLGASCLINLCSYSLKGIIDISLQLLSDAILFFTYVYFMYILFVQF